MELEGAAGGGEVFDLDSLLRALRYGLISFAFKEVSVSSGERSPCTYLSYDIWPSLSWTKLIT